MRKITCQILALLLVSGLHAGISQDSIIYLSPQDTIILQTSPYGEKQFTHVLGSGQTLYSLSRFYGLTVNELYAYNPRLDAQSMRVGHLINIPIPNRAIIRYKTADFKNYEHVPVYYEVQKGETLYGISKRGFKLSVEELMIRNQLESFSLTKGQLLWIGWMRVDGIPREYQEARTKNIKRNYNQWQSYEKRRGNRKENTETGVASWDADNPQDKFYALHNTASIGSYIGVINPMNQYEAYVKVVGRIPAETYSGDVIVVVSSRAAKFLDARDRRFRVEVKGY